MQQSVYVALIHNNNQVRNDYARPKIESMVNSINSDFQIKRIEVSYQSEIVPHAYVMAMMRDVMFNYLAYKWAKYRLLKPRKLPYVISFLRNLFVKCTLDNNEEANKWKRYSAIEVMVTDKHIRAWSQFLDSEADYLIVFEDDAVFKEDSNLRINSLLESLTRNYLNRPCYVDLGGGFSLDQLMITNLEKCHVDNYRYYQKPVTNTACAYLVSRELISKFITTLSRKPWLRLIPIDWMMNSLFISMDKDVSSVVCMHADPPIFKHGTYTGEYISWQVNK